jgi:predicted nucleic acid-binding Zn ribbon protein
MSKQSDDEIQQLAESLEKRRSYVRGPQRMADVVSGLLSRRGYAHEQSAALSLAAWSTAAGPEIARHTRPGNVRRGVLEVYVRNSTVMQELAFQRRQLIQKLTAALPDQKIRDLKFRIGAID